MTSIKASSFFHFDELVKFIICSKVLVIGQFRYLRLNIFSNLYGDLVRAFSNYLVKNNFSKMSL